MNILQKILITLGLLVVIVVGIGFFLPSTWKVERSITINATPEKIYPLIANFETGWPQWSAFDKEYADSHYTSSGAQEGVGAVRSWTGGSMGDGSQTIIKANAQEGIEFELTMIKYDSKLVGKILFSPAEHGTHVTWIDEGNVGNNPIMRWMGLFMDHMLGCMLEKSLQNLKNLVESMPAETSN